MDPNDNKMTAFEDFDADIAPLDMEDEIDVQLVLDDDGDDDKNGNDNAGGDAGAGHDNGGAGGGNQQQQQQTVDVSSYEAQIQAERKRVADLEAEKAAMEASKANHEKELLEHKLYLVEERTDRIKLQIEGLQKDLLAAEEEGDSKQRLEIQNKLDDLRSQKQRFEGARDGLTAQIEQAKNKPKVEPKKEPEKEKQQQQQEQVHPKIASWLQKNPWFSKPVAQKTDEESIRHAFASRIYEDLLREGKSIDDDSFYTDLDRRLAEKTKQFGGQRQTARSPVAQVNSGNGGRKPMSKKTIELNKEDAATMKSLGLNPSDPEQQYEYAKNKRDTMNDKPGEPTMKFPVRRTPQKKK